jgi:predicted CxxxxCH...CXXCH cytochrome family protein
MPSLILSKLEIIFCVFYDALILFIWAGACKCLRTAAVIAPAVLFWGCGTANNDAPSLNTSGKHPAGWVAVNGGNHRSAFNAEPGQCPQCHGNNLLLTGGNGGIARVNCSSTSFAGLTCHADGHLPRIAPHAVPFTDPALHGPAAKKDLSFCQGCHAIPFASAAGSNPRFRANIGSLVNGCEDCHDVKAAHPAIFPPDSVPWRGPVTHRDAANLAVACALCHGVNLDGIGGVGPACSSCHLAGSPLTLKNCTSCHGSPPTGAAFPNISGSHRVHNSLSLVSGVCSTCHTGAGIGSLKHFNQAVDVSVSPAYNAKSGAFTFDPATFTCTNVSCHGGQTTPSWRNGRIDVDTQCFSCHRSRVLQPPDQFNSYFSGKHDFHGNQGGLGLICPDCHDTGKLSPGHFLNLDTHDFDQAPSTTIRDVVRYVGGSCTPVNAPGNFSVTFSCHPAVPLTRVWATP